MKRPMTMLAAFVASSALAAGLAQTQSQPSMLYGVTTAVAPLPAEVLSSPAYAALIDDLRKGGYVIYLRHALTESTNEKSVADFTNCAWQRNLSEPGKRQARIVGARLAEQQIPVAVVEASPFCRTRETAELAFGRAPVLNPGLVYYANQTRKEMAATNAHVRERLIVPPLRGGNLVLVGHSPAMRDTAKVELPEGQGVIVKSNGDGTFRIVGRLTEAGITPQ